MPEISKDHPELAIFLTIEKMEDPVAYFWNLVISLKGEEPPQPIAPRRVFRLKGTTEAIQKALEEYPCDQVNIFAEPECPDGITQIVKSIFTMRASKDLAG
jgi:hypothetical protein